MLIFPVCTGCIIIYPNQRPAFEVRLLKMSGETTTIIKITFVRGTFLGLTFISATDGRGESEQVSKLMWARGWRFVRRIEMLRLMASLAERGNLTGRRKLQANNRALQRGLYVHLAFSWCFKHAKNKTSWKEGHIHCLIMSSLSTLMPLCCDVKRSF